MSYYRINTGARVILSERIEPVLGPGRFREVHFLDKYDWQDNNRFGVACYSLRNPRMSTKDAALVTCFVCVRRLAKDVRTRLSNTGATDEVPF